jgi:hypothetical protein
MQEGRKAVSREEEVEEEELRIEYRDSINRCKRGWQLCFCVAFILLCIIKSSNFRRRWLALQTRWHFSMKELAM